MQTYNDLKIIIIFLKHNVVDIYYKGKEKYKMRRKRNKNSNGLEWTSF